MPQGQGPASPAGGEVAGYRVGLIVEREDQLTVVTPDDLGGDGGQFADEGDWRAGCAASSAGLNRSVLKSLTNPPELKVGSSHGPSCSSEMHPVVGFHLVRIRDDIDLVALLGKPVGKPVVGGTCAPFNRWILPDKAEPSSDPPGRDTELHEAKPGGGVRRPTYQPCSTPPSRDGAFC